MRYILFFRIHEWFLKLWSLLFMHKLLGIFRELSSTLSLHANWSWGRNLSLSRCGSMSAMSYWRNSFSKPQVLSNNWNYFVETRIFFSSTNLDHVLTIHFVLMVFQLIEFVVLEWASVDSLECVSMQMKWIAFTISQDYLTHLAFRALKCKINFKSFYIGLKLFNIFLPFQ